MLYSGYYAEPPAKAAISRNKFQCRHIAVKTMTISTGGEQGVAITASEVRRKAICNTEYDLNIRSKTSD